MDDYQAVIAAPGFALGGRCSDDEIHEIEFLAARPEVLPRSLLAKETVRQLRAYLKDPHFEFTLPLAPAGTPFQRRVWTQISAIPCGQTRCYGDLAATLANAPRAVGGALRDNPALVALIQAEKWDGKLPNTMVPGSAVPFLSVK